MPATRLFRQLVLSSLLLPLIWGGVSRWMLSQAFSQDQIGKIGTVGAIFLILVSLACIVTKIGLYRFRLWARGVNFVLVGMTLLALLLFPIAFAQQYDSAIFSALNELVNALCYLMEGAIVVMSFLVPAVSERFAKADQGRLVERLSQKSV